MVQLNRQSLGRDPLPVPPLVDQYLSEPGSPYSQTIAGIQNTVRGATSPSATDPSIALTWVFYATPLPPAPTGLTATAPTCTTEIVGPTRRTEYDVVMDPTPGTATASGSSITYHVPDAALYVDLTGYLLTAAGFSPAGYNTTDAVITSNTVDTITIATTTAPGTETTSGTVSVRRILVDEWDATVYVTPTADTTAGTIDLRLGYKENGAQQHFDVSLTATAGNVQIALPPPSFAFPNSLSSGTVYDSDKNPTGFILSYTWAESYDYPMYRDGVALPGIWQVTASACYALGASAPAASKWSPILYTGPNLPSPPVVLAAWEALYGDLPASGSIKFQLKYIDPESGASGPALSCAATWEAGTLRGFSRSAWDGPVYSWHLYPDTTTVTAPGTATTTAAVYGSNGYAGTIKFAIAGGSVIPTGYASKKKAMSPGLSGTVSPAEITIPAGDTSFHTVTITMTAANGADAFSGNVNLTSTDGEISSSAPFRCIVNGTTSTPPPPNYLSISPGQNTPKLPSPGSVSVQLVVQNTGPDSLDVSMVAKPGDDRIACTWDVQSFTLDPGTLASPTTQNVTLTATTSEAFTTAGVQVQLTASCGKNTNYAAVTFS
jgi:hypothetical protein